MEKFFCYGDFVTERIVSVLYNATCKTDLQKNGGNDYGSNKFDKGKF